MNDFILKSLDINNFRSIRGKIHAPLDAKAVLIHGENGAGKTSVLSAIELALTGKIHSLERADPSYDKQLLHRSTTEGSVLLQVLNGISEKSFSTTLNVNGAQSITALDNLRATFFRERAFLPQALLGQLLQIYQEAGQDATSPLAKFVAKLLGLDRLDALEAGLKPLTDVRNVRKSVNGWVTAENEKSRLDRLLLNQRETHFNLGEEIQTVSNQLAILCAELELSVDVREETLDEVATSLSNDKDADAFSLLTDQQRKLASIQREIKAAQTATETTEDLNSLGADEASELFSNWEATYGDQVKSLRSRIEKMLSNISLSSDPEQFAKTTLELLNAERQHVYERVTRARTDIAGLAKAQDERDVALRKRSFIDEEIVLLSISAGNLAAALSELSSFISDDTCPVCDRDFSETDSIPLKEHVHGKVRNLSASAERLLILGRARSEIQVTIERLDRDIETIAASSPKESDLANLDRRLAAINSLTSELNSIYDALKLGGKLRAAYVAAYRAMSDAKARDVSVVTAHEVLSEFALSIRAPELGEGESFVAGVTRLEALLETQAVRLEKRLTLRRKAVDLISTIHTAVRQRFEVGKQILADEESWKSVSVALARAQGLREQGNTIRSAVDKVRSAIIRREFNDRLNLVWRDLFVRLAPGEPFIPAFRIPESATERLQPKLITEHRDGGEVGGTPGSMLSAGNLNTGALSLFIALHLSVPRELPCLILDDPVQSMDDVHIAHFAALLKTLSKEHGRQVVIAVHDRQLFEYLKLELSPAFPEDSLLTLELSRGPSRDSVCISQRFSFKQDIALHAVS